jgi:hypothetical protein
LIGAEKIGRMIEQIFVEQPLLAAAILFAAIVTGIFLERARASLARAEHRQRRGGSKSRNWDRKPNLSIVPKADQTPTDIATEQLKTVMAAEFRKRALLNKSELRLFGAVEREIVAIEMGWRVMAQVSLGEIVGSDDRDAYLAINSKRVDLLLVDDAGNPLHVIEYQGKGHHQGSAAARDAVKKEALRRAGIGYFEIAAGDKPEDLKAIITKIIRQHNPLR